MKTALKYIILSYVVLCLNSTFPSTCQARTFPQDFDYSCYSGGLTDAGYLWGINSTFHPLDYQLFDSSKAASDAFDWMYDYLYGYAKLMVSQQGKSNNDLFHSKD